MSSNTSTTQSGEASGSRLIYSGMLLPFVLITACFALWGAANNMTDLLVPAFQRVLSMSTFQSSWIQSAFYGAYFFMAIPAALLIQKYSYKTGVIAGLCIYAFGAFLCYPAGQVISFGWFLVAFYVFASGCAILETVAAPYILSMGPNATATQRINLAQAFNPVGVLLGTYLGKEVILKGLDKADDAARAAMPVEKLTLLQSQELSNVVLAYVIVGLVALALAVTVFVVKFPKKSGDGFGSMKDTLFRLKTDKTWKMAVVAQFFYVGTQIGVFTYALLYVVAHHGGSLTEARAAQYLIYALIAYAAFRFICTALMSYISAIKLLMIMSLIAMGLTAVAVFVGGIVGTYAVLAVYPCMSLMFPTIYGTGLSNIEGDDRKLGGAIIIMSIVGGAALVPIQALIIDNFNIATGFLMSFVGFAVVFVFSILARNANPE